MDGVEQLEGQLIYKAAFVGNNKPLKKMSLTSFLCQT